MPPLPSSASGTKRSAPAERSLWILSSRAVSTAWERGSMVLRRFFSMVSISPPREASAEASVCSMAARSRSREAESIQVPSLKPIPPVVKPSPPALGKGARPAPVWARMSSHLELLYAAYEDVGRASAAKEAVDALMGMHRIPRLASAVVSRGHDGRLVLTRVEGDDDEAVSVVAGFLGLLTTDHASELEERVVRE